MPFAMATNGNSAPLQEEKVNTDIVTLTRFLTEEQAKHKEATGDFTYFPLLSLCSKHPANNLPTQVFYAMLSNSPSNP